ncbi:peptidase E [Bacterioplanes sanyensis]|uniref:Type 1 glutamine amidotransferase-like domain-containing protein n=1 Tax=Bacterioplanes sanyensis TaxID=1249553 RepID=UPI001676DDB1|nr:peptidase E [Bacterioplanes sanyensis]GGY52234.1 peptidase E [Bacterioplanes sanyensis]
MKKHCVVLGGGGWMMGELPSLLDQYILQLSGKAHPKVCYVPTATGDSDEVIQRFYDAKLSDNLSHFPLFKPQLNWREHLLQQDIIYVGGGNTRSMLAIWREWGVDDILRRCYQQGIILCGMSAGAICWFEYGITDSNPEAYSVIPGLGVLPGLAAAHFTDDDEKAALFHQYAHAHPDVPCVGLSDYAGLHFIDGEIEQAIYSQQEARVTVANRPTIV